MSPEPFISICIPAYKRLSYLKRLIESINIQNYKNFEVIVTDDSGPMDNEVENYFSSNSFKFKIDYFKNSQPLGSPKNWIASIDKANGEWIKIMHDDDSFSNPDSLSFFANAVNENSECIFSGYLAKYENGNVFNKTINHHKFNKILKHPFYLFSNNIIGPPSVMMFRKKLTEKFDERLKWIVDWEFYIRLAKKYKLKYIQRPLINVSYNDSQITNSCFLNPAVEIPETLIFTNKYGSELFDYIWAYDAWWRLIRNLKIKSDKELIPFSNGHYINEQIFVIISIQKYIPASILRIGFFSKISMFFSFCINWFKK